MEQIASFTVNHMRLLPGIYVSRKDSTGQDVVTTYDIRMTRPNFEPVMNTAEIHTIEHLGATFLRNHEEWGDRIVYFVPPSIHFHNIHSDTVPESEDPSVSPPVRKHFHHLRRCSGGRNSHISLHTKSHRTL